jgi:acetyl-CoA C-acetyltransferase
MREVMIVDGVRTPIGRRGGALSGIQPEMLAVYVVQELMKRTKLDPATIDDLIIGTAFSTHIPINPARWIGMKAGLPYTVPGMTLERQCGSGLQAVMLAAQAIQSGNGEVYVVGGYESHSQCPYYVGKPTEPFSVMPPTFLVRQTGPDARTDWPMGITAENLAEQYGISREEQDRFGLLSQERALRAIREGYFREEIAPVPVPQRKGPPLLFDTDEHPRETTLDQLSKLRAAFKTDGTVTAGNASGLNDGAVALLVMEGERASALGYRPLGRLLSQAVVGVDPAIMGIAPAYAIPKALKRAGIAWSDVAVVECNEAFAAQTLAVAKELERQGYPVDMEKLNPNGGAIALGHPNGMSGGRLTLTLLKELRRKGARYGIASLCVGGGQGVAGVFESLP